MAGFEVIGDTIGPKQTICLRRLFYILSPLPLIVFLITLQLDVKASPQLTDVFGYSAFGLSFALAGCGWWVIRREQKAGRNNGCAFFASMLAISPVWVVMGTAVWKIIYGHAGNR